MAGDDGEWVPEFGGQRPPFAAGNELAVRHGAFSERRAGPLAREIEAALRAGPDTPPYLAEAKFDHSVRAWARAEAVVELLWLALDGMSVPDMMSELTAGTEDESRPVPGGVRRKARQRRTQPPLDALMRAESRAASLRRDLGLSPAAYASLARDVGLVRQHQADEIERLGAIGREIRLRREAALRAAAEAEDPGDGAG